MKLKKEIGIVTDIKSYKKALELYYEEFTGKMFEREMIQEFIDTYQLGIQFNITFANVWNDLAKIKFDDEIGIITDKQSYLKGLKLYYSEFSDNILFDEDIISKFISTYHLDTRFHISLNDVWNDLAKIKRQSELEYEIMDEIEGVEDIETYKDALELYYNVFGDDMFAIDKVQSFINTFKLNKLDITSNIVYRDLRAIKRAFESGNEVSYKNSKPVQANTEPNKTTNITQEVQPPQNEQTQTTISTPPTQPQDKQTQTTSTKPPVQKQSILDTQTLFDYIKTMPVKWEYANPNLSPGKDLQQLCNTFLTGMEIPKCYSRDVIMNMEYTIQTKRARTPNKADYNKVMERNILFELFKYSYYMNFFKVLEDRKNDKVDIDNSEFANLIREDCLKRFGNLENEKRKTPAIQSVLQKYEFDTQGVKMIVNDYVEPREYDYIYAYLMTWTLMNIVNFVLYSELKIGNGYQPTIQIVKKYPANDLITALDTYLASTINLALNMYTSGGKLPTRPQ